MQDKKPSTWKSTDWITVALYIVLTICGWFSICSANFDFDSPSFFDLSGRPGMQLAWIGVSSVVIFVIMTVDKNFFETLAYPIYVFVILALLATVFLAPDIKGSRSWLVITPSIRLQPAELAKFATALALAKFMSSYKFNLLDAKNFMISALIVLAPMICIIMQKETGSALVFLAFALVFYREGMSGYILLTSICFAAFFVIELKYKSVFWNYAPIGELAVAGIILAIVCIVLRFVLRERAVANYVAGAIAFAAVAGYVVSRFFIFNFLWVALGLIIGVSIYLILLSMRRLVWHYALLAFFALISAGFMSSVDYVYNDVLEPHQQQRIRVFLGLKDDPSGAGYNVNQSKIAIGSGGFSGKGFLNGTQTKLRYVPEQDTDFIFCTVGEEFGFLGSLFVLAVYGAFLLRLLALAERQPTVFGRVYGYSVVSIFFFHAVVNIGMVCGITPVIGIPLPFFSYGGSSLLGFTILLFIFLRIDSAHWRN